MFNIYYAIFSKSFAKDMFLDIALFSPYDLLFKLEKEVTTNLDYKIHSIKITQQLKLFCYM